MQPDTPDHDHASTPVPLSTPHRRLGRTGQEVAILGVGLADLIGKLDHPAPDELHQQLLSALRERRLNYWDTCSSLHERPGLTHTCWSEELLGPVVAEARDDVVLASKTCSRDYDGFMRDLERSLDRLHTDYIDLYLVGRLDGSRDNLDALARGAVWAAQQARENGIIGACGVSGQADADILIHAVRHWDIDVVQAPLDASRPDRGRFEDELLPLAAERDLGVIAYGLGSTTAQGSLPLGTLARYPLSLPGVSCLLVSWQHALNAPELTSMAASFTPLDADTRRQLHHDLMLTQPEIAPPVDLTRRIGGRGSVAA